MRRKDREITDSQEIFNILQRCNTLSTLSGKHNLPEARNSHITTGIAGGFLYTIQ